MKTNFKGFLANTDWVLSKKVLKWNFTESIEIDISEHGTFSSDSIEKKVIATKKSEFYFTIRYNKQVK